MAHTLAKLRGVKIENIKKILKADAPNHAEQGLYLEHLWQNEDDSEEVLFLFRGDDLNRAKQLIQNVHTQARKEDPNANLPQMTFLEENNDETLKPHSLLRGSVMDTAKTRLQPKIARIWRGRTTTAKADEYARYLHEYGFKPLVKKALGVQMFRADREGESHFVTISYWESVEAMSRFAGPDPKRIHHLERDAEFLIELPQGVEILDIIDSSGLTGSNE